MAGSSPAMTFAGLFLLLKNRKRAMHFSSADQEAHRPEASRSKMEKKDGRDLIF
jgi:hypothetical protein